MSISPWISFFIGLIAGLFIGIFVGRKNYESCRDQLDKMTADLQARKADLGAIEAEIDNLHHTLKTSAKTTSNAETTAELESGEAEVDQETLARTVEVPTEEAAAAAGAAAKTASDSVIEAVEEEVGEEAPDRTVEVPTEEAAAAAGAAPESISEEKPTSTPEAVKVKNTISRCPQKLARIRGIGRVYEDKLYHAGIGTFWQVAIASHEQLTEIFGLKDFQAVDLNGIKADAKRLAEETDTIGHVWSGEKPDDFESLPGIGKTYEARLYDAGICTFEKLAAMTVEEVAAIVKAPKWNQPNYAAWIAFAKGHIQKNS